MSGKFLRIVFSAVFAALLLFPKNTPANEAYERYVSLKGMWKFSIGDDKKWASPNYNDASWQEIYAPAPWEDEGFHGYNGYAWYRKHFKCPEQVKGKSIYLEMGYIDDADEIYINGNIVGFSGEFPPGYKTAYNAYRKYPVPEKFLKINGDNVIAVRVYDSQLGGGIIGGNLGLYGLKNSISSDLSLEGEWKFHPNDNSAWRDKDFDDTKWDKMFVPGFWETQGYENYDGYGWYRKSFILPAELKGKKLVLMLGKIDDMDEVYLNGKLIGSTGDWSNRHPQTNDYDWQQFRGYFIPDNLLAANQNNVIAVRVYDGYVNGGMYQGPVGLVEQDKYTKYWKEHKKKKKSFWEEFFED